MEPGEGVTGQVVARLALFDLSQIFIDACAHFGRRIGRGGPVEVVTRQFVRPHFVIQRPELELHARQIGVEQQHPFERRDCPFIIPQPGRYVGIGKGHIEICRIPEHLLEQCFLLCLESRLVFGSNRLRRCQDRREQDGNGDTPDNRPEDSFRPERGVVILVQSAHRTSPRLRFTEFCMPFDFT